MSDGLHADPSPYGPHAISIVGSKRRQADVFNAISDQQTLEQESSQFYSLYTPEKHLAKNDFLDGFSCGLVLTKLGLNGKYFKYRNSLSNTIAKQKRNLSRKKIIIITTNPTEDFLRHYHRVIRL